MKIKKNFLLKMSIDELHIYIKKDMVVECIKENGIDKSLPLNNYLIDEKEILID
jgi:hypothetical protein